ncbi:MAG: HPr family phosphocarrier protein [Selenomonadaceae bacterium]|nr:HPr family phosphocarrier protein [Selenomonadaceae bacterium]
MVTKKKDFAALNIKFKNVYFEDDKKVSTPEKIPTPPSQNKAKSPDNTARATTTINIDHVDGDAAAAFVMKAKNFKSHVWLNRAKYRNGGGNGIVSIVTMHLTKGDKVTVTAESEDAKQAVAELKMLIDSVFPGATLKDIENFSIATTTIENQLGMHSRPASVFVQKASSFKSKIQIIAKGKTVDAKSILMIMSLLCFSLSKSTPSITPAFAMRPSINFCATFYLMTKLAPL